MSRMDRPQFSLLRWMGAVTCFAVAVALATFQFGDSFFPPRFIGLWAALVILIPGVGVGILTRKGWLGAVLSMVLAVFFFELLHLLK